MPDFEQLERFARAANLEYANYAELIKDPQAIQKIEDEITLKSEHLAGFERIKKFVLLDAPFTIEANELTPTIKVKRKTIENKFSDRIDGLYAE